MDNAFGHCYHGCTNLHRKWLVMADSDGSRSPGDPVFIEWTHAPAALGTSYLSDLAQKNTRITEGFSSPEAKAEKPKDEKWLV
jgi:hypothetical protein